MQTLHQDQPLPPHVLEAAGIPDQGNGDLHPVHREIAYVAELTAIRDSLRHFIPPRTYEVVRMGSELCLEGVDTSRKNYRTALEVLTEEAARTKSHLLRTTAEWFPGDHRTLDSQSEAMRFDEARTQWDKYDASLIRFVKTLPSLQRINAVFNDEPQIRFPTYAPSSERDGLRFKTFAYYPHLLSAYRQTLDEREETEPGDSGVDSMRESISLLPPQAHLEALHGMYEQESFVLAPRFAINEYHEKQLLLAEQNFGQRRYRK